MTIKGTILREAFAARQKKADAERRKLHRRFAVRTALEMIGATIAFIVAVLVFWAIIIATPDQTSAECEALRAEMEAKGE